MSSQKNKSIENLEERMEGLNPSSLRYQILDAARSFKSSWIDLGRYLYSVYKDKMYKDWGYLTFEAYTAKEIGIRQTTAVKLLKSYSFLEQEEPQFLKQSASEERKPDKIPGFESVNALRLAKASERLTPKEYESLREDVLVEPRDEEETKKKIRYVLSQHSPSGKRSDAADPAERKAFLYKKLTSQLQAAKEEMISIQAPAKVIHKMEELIELLS